MKSRKTVILCALIAAVGLSSPIWWLTHAQGTQMPGFKRYPPEDFFAGQQLVLALAIRDGNLAAVKALAPETDLAELGNKKTSLLSFAVQEVIPVKNDAGNVRYQIISELVRDGAKAEQPFGATDEDIAFVAARADNPYLLKALLAGGMSPDLRYDGDTPLLFAACEDSLLSQLRTLIEHRADVNIRDSVGYTALFQATGLRQWDTVDYLLAHGADPTVSDNRGAKYAKALSNELHQTPANSPQLPRIEAIRKRIVAAGVQWPPN